jgi:hypothetical protein
VNFYFCTFGYHKINLQPLLLQKPFMKRTAEPSKKRARDADDDGGLLPVGIEEVTMEESKGDGTGVACLDPKDIIQKDKSVRFCIAVDSATFLRRSILMARPMLDYITLWLCNNTDAYKAAKAVEEAGGPPCTINPFSGISIDSMDAHMVSMTVARMPLPPDSVHLFSEDGNSAPEEIGVTVLAKSLLEALQGVKEYPKMILYSEWGSDRLCVLVVSTAHDSYLSEIPLCASEAQHETVKNWEMKFDLSMPMTDLKETIKRAASLDADNVHFEMKRWSEQGLIFVISTESRSGGLFRAFQVTYTTTLKKNMTAEVNYALEKLKDAQSLYNAAEKGAKSSATLLANVEAAETELKGHLLALYDSMDMPEGLDRPVRTVTEKSTLVECESAVRLLQAAVRSHKLAHSDAASSTNAAVYMERMDAMASVEVATSFCNEIREAPFRKSDIKDLPSEYDAWFSVKKLQDMLKTPQSPGVQLHLPKDSSNPLAIRFDTGGGDFMSFVSFILAPRVDQDS